MVPDPITKLLNTRSGGRSRPSALFQDEHTWRRMSMKTGFRWMMAAVCTVLLSVPVLGAAPGYVEKSIGNVSFEVPDDLTDNSTPGGIVSYMGDGYLVSWSHYDLDMEDMSATLQELFIDTSMKTYEDADGYVELENVSGTWQDGLAVNYRDFYIEISGTTYELLVYGLYCEDGITVVTMGLPLWITSDQKNAGRSVMEHIGDTIKTDSWYLNPTGLSFEGSVNLGGSDKETSTLGGNTAAATTGEKNALEKAKSYLRYSAFSYTGLIDQLEYEGYSTSEATYGADNCGADWYEQAVKKAQSYLSHMSFSKSGLIDQLEFEGFTTAQAQYAVENCGTDWDGTSTGVSAGKSNALEKAKSYLSHMAFSYTGLIDQLEFEGYSHEEAVYGADNCGADWYEQAAKKAESYLSHSSFSRSELISQLEFEGFTNAQAVYGVTQAGL